MENKTIYINLEWILDLKKRFEDSKNTDDVLTKETNNFSNGLSLEVIR